MTRWCLVGALCAGMAVAAGASAQTSPLLPDAPPLARAKPDSAVDTAPLLPRNAFTAPAIGPTGGGRLWFGTEYLMWWSKASPAAPLAVAGNPPPSPGPVVGTTPLATAPGFIGLTNITGVPSVLAPTQTPFGNSLHTGPQSGFRVTLGGWLDSSQTLGLEGTYLLLLNNPARYDAVSGGNPALAIPLVNPITGGPLAYPIALPPTTQTTVQLINTTPGVFVHLLTRNVTDRYSGTLSEHNGNMLQGGELNAIWNPVRASNWRLQGLAGARFLQFDEALRIDSTVNHVQTATTVYEPALGLGVGPLTQTVATTTQRSDVFTARNGFYGGQLGARGEYRLGRWSLFGGAKVALGDMHQIVQTDGSTQYTATATSPPTVTRLLAGIPITLPAAGATTTTTTSGTSPGGLLAQPGNLGHYSRDVFAVVPEGNFRIAYRLTSRLTASVGYTFLYLSDVVRPATLVNPAISPAVLTTPPGVATTHPALSMHGSDYWAQGVDFGLLYRY